MTPQLVAPADGIRAAAMVRRSQALLVAISGIDGSGKSTLAGKLATRLAAAGRGVACIGVDPWQNPQTVRFGGPDRGLHFYCHAIRFDALFSELVEPLVRTRRALVRNAEGRPADLLCEDYATIYHAAQRHHLAADDPRARADFALLNDRDTH